MDPSVHWKLPVIPESEDRRPEIEGRFANHFQVGQNGSEFLIDFGQDFGGRPPNVHTRIIVNANHVESFLALAQRTAAEIEE